MRPLEDVQDEILDRLHAGETVDRAEVLAAHPEHADALRQFFSVLDIIEAPPAPAAPAPGRLGEFRIVREVGRGGMGIVYEAEQTSLGRRVALKVLPPALRTDGRVLARFRREAEAAGRLRHPNVVPVYAFGEAAGTPFYVMELVDGRSLAEIIEDRRAGRFDSAPADPDAYRRWAADVVARVGDALDYAHGRGILDRDVKPGNVLVEKDGTPRLSDFGLALDMEAASLTLAGEVFGSPLYMSPEQAFRREAPLDARSDVYSLAVTFYELLTGKLPYDATTQAEVLTALSAGSVVSARVHDPGIPEPLDRVLLRAMRRDPHERHATAAAFAEDVRAAMAGKPVSMPPLPSPVPVAAAASPPIPVRYPTPSKGWHPLVWVAIGLGAVLLLCVAGSAVLFMGTAARAPAPMVARAVQAPILLESDPNAPDVEITDPSAPAEPVYPMDATTRNALVGKFVEEAKGTFSGKARELLVRNIPTIPGGITAAELADATSEMFSTDKRLTVVTLMPLVRRPLGKSDIEALTEDLYDSDQKLVLEALVKAGSALPSMTRKPKPPDPKELAPGEEKR